MKNPEPAEVERILAIRREAGLKIDSATAEVTRGFIGEIYYGVKDSPKARSYLYFEYFARAPGTDIWVAFQDLPADTRETLSARQRARELEVEQFIAIRREAGLHIDPATAEVDWWYAQEVDPYGSDADTLPALQEPISGWRSRIWPKRPSVRCHQNESRHSVVDGSNKFGTYALYIQLENVRGI